MHYDSYNTIRSDMKTLIEKCRNWDSGWDVFEDKQMGQSAGIMAVS